VSLVVTRLIGGLGNQMFQYATARALALRCGAVLKLDLSGFDSVSGNTPRRYELDAFPIEAAITSRSDLAQFGLKSKPSYVWRKYVNRVLRTAPRNSIYPIYRERHFHFDAALMTLTAPIYLEGYWQSEKYFLPCADTLRREFCPTAPLEPQNAAFAAAIDAVNSISLHVRRGDYVNDPRTKRYHGVCSLDYYRQAVEYIKTRVAAPHLFVFSDDHEWPRRELDFGLPTTFVDANPPDRGYRDMQLMARCRHHIVANSSFSWWGAWLSTWPEKIVIAPRRWFASSEHDTRDLIPERWLRV
jgi:Glycosyl transferase family 11